MWTQQLNVVVSLCLTLLAGAASAQELRELKGETERLSYALGMAYGAQIQKESIHLDLAAFIQGLEDVRSAGKTLLTEGEARSLVMMLQEEVRNKELARQAEKLQAENELAAKNLREGEAFLAGNRTREGVVALDSGLQYKVLKAGSGQKPTLDDMVVCHYRGKTLEGVEFDSTYIRKKPAKMPVRAVIKGWRQALQRMPLGSKWRLFVPSKLAYGARAGGRSFGPNSTLIFEVELISIEEKPKLSLHPPAPANSTASARAAR